jgi:lambda repressor-like predicted transcriptional regulator
MADMLRQFLGTHRSVRLLMKKREENPASMADAMSLAREQVEKVYAVALLVEDPEGWTERYLKDAWRTSYERHLIDAHERNGLPRYEDSLDQRSEDLDRKRRSLGITDEEEECVEWSFENPPWLSQKRPKTPKHLLDAEKSIATFPTPGGTIKKVTSDSLKEALVRLYREYSYLCGYSHSGFSKLLPGYMEGHMSLTTSEKQKVVETEYNQSIMLSYLGAGIACAEAATRKLPRDPAGTSGPPRPVVDANLLVKLSDLWGVLQSSSLLGRALYEMRLRHILPPTMGAA